MDEHIRLSINALVSERDVLKAAVVQAISLLGRRQYYADNGLSELAEEMTSRARQVLQLAVLKELE